MNDDWEHQVPSLDPLRGLTIRGQDLGDLMDQLQPGGPPADEQAIMLYLADALDAESKAAVGTQIATWQSWNQTYWEISGDLIRGAELDRLAEASPAPPGADGEDTTIRAPTVAAPPAEFPLSRRLRWISASLAAVALAVMAIAFWPPGNGPDQLVVQLDDPFGTLTKSTSGVITGLEQFPPGYRDDIRTMLQRESVQIPGQVLKFATATRGTRGVSMYVSPVDTVVRSPTPVFSWKPRSGDLKYRVVVYSSDGSTIESGDLGEPSWRPDEPFQRGEDYAWDVVVFQDGEELISAEPRPRFKVLASEAENELTSLESAARQSPLVLTVAYLRHGLLDEGADQLQQLARANPESNLAKTLLDSLGESR